MREGWKLDVIRGVNCVPGVAYGGLIVPRGDTTQFATAFDAATCPVGGLTFTDCGFELAVPLGLSASSGGELTRLIGCPGLVCGVGQLGLPGVLVYPPN